MSPGRTELLLERAMGIEPTSEPWERVNVMACPPASGAARLRERAAIKINGCSTHRHSGFLTSLATRIRKDSSDSASPLSHTGYVPKGNGREAQARSHR